MNLYCSVGILWQGGILVYLYHLDHDPHEFLELAPRQSIFNKFKH